MRLGELNSIRRTADALGLSQPAVTQCLADLERLVEIRLFDRHARGLRVTRAGRDVLPLARRMLDALAEASEALTAARQREEGVVRVAAITGAVGGLQSLRPQAQAVLVSVFLLGWSLLRALLLDQGEYAGAAAANRTTTTAKTRTRP